jgi:hypothetical protein
MSSRVGRLYPKSRDSAEILREKRRLSANWLWYSENTMGPRTRFYVFLLAGIMTLILPIADYYKGTSTSSGILHIAGPIFMAVAWFGLAIKAKKDVPRQR